MHMPFAKSFLSGVALLGFLSTITPAMSQTADEVTFHKDIEPILQRSCQSCHRDGGAGPMPLVTYEQVAPFAGLIEYKTGLRDRAGAMPPWYMEKNIGIQDYKDDPSLSDEESRRYQAGPEMELQRVMRKMHPKHLFSMTA